MSARILIFALVPVWIFLCTKAACWLMETASDHDDKWWGGYSLWMAGALPLFGILVGGLVLISGLALGASL